MGRSLNTTTGRQLFRFSSRFMLTRPDERQLCIMVRKLVATALITLTRGYGIVVQAQLACLVFVIALVFHVIHQPFKNRVVNILETMSISAFILTVPALNQSKPCRDPKPVPKHRPGSAS